MRPDMQTPFVGGQSLAPANRKTLSVTHKLSGEPLAEVAVASAEDLEAATVAAIRAFHELRAWPRHQRRDLLQRIADKLVAERQSLGELIAKEAGKPMGQALAEVDRGVMTFSLAADEARRMGGEVVPLDIDPRAAGMTGLVHRFPIGPISAISPFNFPLNLLAHKVAPALAVGSTLVVKPPPQCPLTAFRLAEIVHACGAPAGAVNVLHLELPLAEKLATDARFRLLSFTGSPTVGWHLKNIAGKKKVLLELGGNAAAVVHEDSDVDWVASRLALGAFAYAGQVCIKVQRIYVHRPIFARFVEALTAATRALKVGDPLAADTVVGPMIDVAAAERVEAWVAEAEAHGAKAVLRGKRQGALLSPTLLVDTRPEMKVSSLEIFGPVATLTPYDDFDEALKQVDDSTFGLQAGIFTHDVRRIFKAFNQLEVGGVVINDFPTLRIDNYPYGGVKDSGFGREGVRYAVEEMTEPRMLVLNLNR